MDNAVYAELVSKMKKKLIPIDENLSFRELTTLGCGGTIKLTVYPTSVKQMVFAVKLLTKLGVPFVVLGKGSNTLASDEPYDGVVVSALKMNKLKLSKRGAYAQAGVSTLNLGKQLREHGLSGGEFLSCLPASVGGATVSNAGCFGQEMSSIVKYVTVLCNGRVKRIPASQCGFAKRRSLFKNNADYVVLGVRLKLVKRNAEEISATIADMRARKAATQPLDFRSAGCTLYHDKVAVSRLIDQAGLKGYMVGRAQISTKHAGFVVNLDKARSKDIYLVMLHAKNTLYNRFGVCAKVEVNLVNFTKDEEDDIFAGSKK